MLIRYGKGKNGKPDTLTCVRDDGTTTWEHTAVGIKHDLLHYAVETTLGFREGFYGLVAAGRDIADFGTREGQKDALPAEAEWAESIVGLLQWPALAGASGLSDAEFFATLEQTCAADGRHAPRVTPEQLRRMRERARALYAAWDRLAPGEALELAF